MEQCLTRLLTARAKIGRGERIMAANRRDRAERVRLSRGAPGGGALCCLQGGGRQGWQVRLCRLHRTLSQECERLLGSTGGAKGRGA